MLRGLYTSAAGMEASLRRNDVISNNLSNINTTGYKKQIAIEKSFPNQLLQKIDNNNTAIGEVGGGVAIDSIANDQSIGDYEETGNKLDWAIKGEGFFVVQTPQGVRYTRNGNFTVNNQGQVVTQDGHLVRGENGILQIPNQGEVTLDGENLIVDDKIIGKIQIRSFTNKSGLIREGSTLFRSSPQAGSTYKSTGKVLQGYLEGANVSPIQEMVKMIDNNRTYQADQKIVKAHNDTLGKAVNEVGKV